MMRNWIFFVLLIGGYLNVTAQPPSGEFYIKGKVIENTTQKPLEYVNVVVYKVRDSSIVSGTITNTKGEFNIKLSRPGKFYLTADFIGYEKTYVDQVFLKPGNEVFNTGTISIVPAKIGIEEVEVVAEKPFVMYQVDKKVVDVSRNPSAQGGTAVDALENVPSVQVDIEGEVSVRGSSDFTVLIDGRQSPLTGSDALNQIQASAIDKIEIITNPSAKYDPDGTAGIINIITKKGKLDGHSMVVNASLGNSPMYSADINYSYQLNKFRFTGGIDYRDFQMGFENDNRRFLTDTALDGSDSSSTIYNLMDGSFQRKSFGIKGGIDYNLSEQNTLSVGVRYNDFTFARYFDSKIRTVDSEEDETYEMTYSGFDVNPVSWQLTLSDQHIFNGDRDHMLQIEFMGQWSEEKKNDLLEEYLSDENWNNIGLKNPKEKALTNEKGTRYRLEVEYGRPISEHLKLEAGYTHRTDLNTQDYTRFILPEDASDWIPNTEFDDRSDYSRYINAGWAVLNGEFNGVQLSAGLRGEHTDRTVKTEKEAVEYDYNYLGWYPTFALSKEFNNGHQLQGSYSKRINRPRDHHLNPFPGLSDDYSAFVPNPELKPEIAGSFEINYQKSWGPSFLAMETFYNKTTDKMTRVYLNDSTTLTRTIKNLGSDVRIGAELAGNIRVVKWYAFNPMLSVYYQEIEGEYRNEITTKENNTWRASLNNNFTLPTQTKLQLMAQYRGASVSLDGESDPIYWISGAIRQDFFERKLTAVLRVEDIFGTRKRKGTSDNGTVHYEMHRNSPMIFFSLSYKFNQKNGDRRKRGENGNNGGEMDMDF